MPAVDILLPVRNGAQFLEEAINSIRNQSFVDWRLNILDHGSQDSSQQISERFADVDKRIRVFVCPEADSLAGLLNFGLSHCDSHIVMRQDADDVSFPSRIALVNEAFQQNAKLLAVGGDTIVIDLFGKRIGALCMPKSPSAIAAASLFNVPSWAPQCRLICHCWETMAPSMERLAAGGADV